MSSLKHYAETLKYTIKCHTTSNETKAVPVLTYLFYHLSLLLAPFANIMNSILIAPNHQLREYRNTAHVKS